MSAPRHFILATAGHVDHGKSALVKALTGTDPDRLPEERLRITIDLGFAHLDLPSATGDSSIVLGIVDVPGCSRLLSAQRSPRSSSLRRSANVGDVVE